MESSFLSHVFNNNRKLLYIFAILEIVLSETIYENKTELHHIRIRISLRLLFVGKYTLLKCTVYIM